MPGQIAIRDVYKHYGAFTAIDHVSLDVRAGEFLTLLGPSGSGKTTLLNVLAGFIRPESGSIRVDGQEFLTLPPHKRDLGMVFQNYALFPHMSVAENVAYPLRLRKVPGAERDMRVRRALDMVQMGQLGERTIQQLSGGQRQRVALARAMVFEPKIMLMDEPLSALDKNLREHMQVELKRLHERVGMTTIYVTHDQREALTLSHRIAVLNKGRLAQLDTPEALYERPVDRFVGGFIGESAFLSIQEQGHQVLFQQRPLRLPGGSVRQPGRAHVLLVRPERLHWQPVAGTEAMNRIDAKVRDVLYQGDSFHVGLALADGSELAARLPKGASGSTAPMAGQDVQLWLHADDTLLVAESA